MTATVIEFGTTGKWCSFCNLPVADCKTLIGNYQDNPTKYICGLCVAKCHSLIKSE